MSKLTESQREMIAEFVRRNPLGVVSTISADLVPSGATVYFSTTPDLHFYFMTRMGTTKVKNIMDTPRVAITIFDDRTLETVQLSGEANLVEEPEKMRHAMNMLQRIVSEEKKYRIRPAEEIVPQLQNGEQKDWAPPLSQLNAGDYVAVEVRPDQVRFRVYESSEVGEARFQEHAGTLD